jgi:hypothetical protein
MNIHGAAIAAVATKNYFLTSKAGQPGSNQHCQNIVSTLKATTYFCHFNTADE